MVLHGLHGTYGELTDRTEDLTSKHWDVRDTSINNTNYEIWIDLIPKALATKVEFKATKMAFYLRSMLVLFWTTDRFYHCSCSGNPGVLCVEFV